MIIGRIIFPALVLLPLIVIGFGLYSMSKGDIEDIVICAVNEESHYIPAGVCEYYLLNYRGTEEDVQFLESRSGLAFLFEISDKSKRQAFLEYVISKGISIDKRSSIDGYTPLHAAIVHNDPELVAFLLEKGASPDQKDQEHHLTPKEFVKYLSQKNPSTDRSAVLSVLSVQ